METHRRVAAGLHIVAGALVLATIAFVMLFAGGVLMFADGGLAAFGLLAALGMFFVVCFGIVGVGQIAAGVCYMRGIAGARVWLIVFSIVALINFPLGTALGVYSLWAFLSEAGSPTHTSRTDNLV